MTSRTVRLYANLLVLVSAAVLVARASAESGVTINGVEVPWGVISTIISSFAAVVTLLLRSSLSTMRIEFNHQMTEALKATLEKGRLEGAAEEKAKQAAGAIAKAEGLAEGKAGGA